MRSALARISFRLHSAANARRSTSAGRLGTLGLWAVALGFCVGSALRAESPSVPAGSRPDPIKTADVVDRTLAAELQLDSPAKVAPRVDDESFLRRVSLDLIGRTPTPEQTSLFTLDPDPAKRAKVVQTLLADPRYGDNWARYWRDVIFYRRTEERSIIAAETCSNFLAEQLNANKSWDQIAAAFITAEGNVQENGATGLIFAQQGEPESVVAEVTRIFSGIQISCAQCHDHPTDRWKREQFHHMAAFFPRIAARQNMTPDGKRTFLITATDFEPRFRPRNAMQRFAGTLEHHMPDLQDPSAKGTQMQPVFVITGQSLDFGVKDADRRGQFARWLSSPENPWFARALVNRLWSELVGEGFYEPVDDLGPDRECSAPDTLDQLAQAFTASGYDVKFLVSTIVATEAYQRDSRNRRAPDETPFTANAAQRLRADQLYNQLVDLLGLNDFQPPRGAPMGPMIATRSARGQFNAIFGYDPSVPRDEISGSIPQALALMNAPQLNAAISANRGLLGRLLRDLKNDDDIVLELYLKALGREPTAKERQTCLDYVRAAPTRGEAYEDVLWSLVNSTEFLHRR